ncbi:MAG: sulfite exporter TauE/SafE family protein [Flavobacteriaceae bacterium]
MDPFFLFAATTLSFLLAGVIKGIIGIGLPLVSIGLLTAMIGLKPALAIAAVPIILANAWQATTGGDFRPLFARLWPFMVGLFAFTFVGVWLLASADPHRISSVFGIVLITYSTVSLAGFQVPPPGRHEKWMTPLFGAVSGVINGLTASYVVPGILYLQALGLPRDRFVQGLGIVLCSGGAALALALGGNGLITRELGLMSLFALLPTFAGLLVGRRIRRRLSEQAFRRVFFLFLLALGVYIIARAFLG